MPEVEVELSIPSSVQGTKRSSDYDEYGEIDTFKRSRGENMQLRLLLVGRYCGAVIGKGGENISRLRKQYNVDVNMPATRTSDRVFTIEGTLDDCVGVVKEILPICSQAPYPVNQKCALEINLLVQTDSVGSVIGKGGHKIKEIREESSGKIKVYQECLPNSNERVVAIGGDDETQVITAVKIVLNTLSEQPRRSAVMYYDPTNKPSEIMGGGGLSGSGLSNTQNTWGNDGQSGGGEGILGTGGPGGFGMNQRPMGNNNVPSLLGNTNRGGVPSLLGNTDRGDRGDNQNTNDSDVSDFLQLHTVTSITVPNDMCGAIIGKSGIRIREVRNTSGAKINFTESDKESKEDRIITITGTQQQIQVAEQLMTQCVRNRTN